MIHMAMVFRTPREIHDCLLFTYQCNTMALDTGGEKARYFFSLESQIPDYWLHENKKALLTCSKHSSSQQRPKNKTKSKGQRRLRPHAQPQDLVFLRDRLDRVHREGMFNRNLRIRHSFVAPYTNPERESMEFWVGFIPCLKISMLVNAHLASCLSKFYCAEFRSRLLENLIRHYKHHFTYVDVERISDHIRRQNPGMIIVELGYLIDFVSVPSHERIDWHWQYRMNHLVTIRMLLEESMAWLSTLGGAHSSLGEYFSHHAEMAGHISVSQLRIALRMGDPLTVARCYMFWAYSLLQKGELSKPRRIVRQVHRFASTHLVRDIRLINMCLSAWARLQHLYRLQRRRNAQVREIREINNHVEALPAAVTPRNAEEAVVINGHVMADAVRNDNDDNSHADVRPSS